jgi:hypothetical protein
MKAITKLAMVACLLALCACYTAQDCSRARCMACPQGQTPALKPPECCRCVPVAEKIDDCSNVRCAACPAGQHPALTPPECCRCVPD